MFWETCLTQAQIDRYVSAGHWHNRLLWDYVSVTADAKPQKVAVVDSFGRLTYGDLVVQAKRCALGLLRLGVRVGDVITVQVPNRNEHSVLTLASELIGAVLNPVPWILRRRELGIITQLARSKVLVVQPSYRKFDHAQLALDIQATSQHLEHLISIEHSVRPGFTSWDELLNQPSLESDQRVFDYLRPDPNQVALLAFTSGTTGMPKGALHTHNTMIANVDAVSRARDFGEDLILHMVYQLGHVAGHFWGVRMPLQVGGTVILKADYSPAETLRTIEAERVTMLWGPDLMLIELLSSPAFRPEAIKTVRLVNAQGDALTRQWAEKALRYTKLANSFAMTEMGIATTTAPGSTPREILDTDGRALPGVEIRIVGDDGVVRPPNVPGRLLIRSPFNFVGYCQGRAFSHQYLSDDGWFDTEDSAQIDHEGFVKWKGRIKDVIRRGGVNVPAREIEDLLRQHPALLDVAIVPVPDERLGERACACVVVAPNSTFSLDDARDLLDRAGVTKQYWPEHLEAFEEFPRTVLGKVAKPQLRIAVEQRFQKLI